MGAVKKNNAEEYQPFNKEPTRIKPFSQNTFESKAPIN